MGRVPVVVFDEAEYGLKKKNVVTKPKETSKRPSSTPSSFSNIKTANNATKNLQDEIADVEISSLLPRIKASVDDIVLESLTGKERNRFLLKKMEREAGIESKNHASFKVRMGMLKKEKERAKKQAESIRHNEAVIAKSQQLTRKIKERARLRKQKRHKQKGLSGPSQT